MHKETIIKDRSRPPPGYKSKLWLPKEKTNTTLPLGRLFDFHFSPYIDRSHFKSENFL